MSARRIEVNLNSSISKFLNPTQPPILFLELRFHFNYRKLLRNLAGELIEMEAYPTTPTSFFPFQIQPLRLLDLPLCRSHLDDLFSCFVFDYQLREFLTYRIANFLIFLANRYPFLGFPVVADVNIIHEDLLDANPIDLTMIMDEVSQEVIPRSASSSVLNKLRKWRPWCVYNQFLSIQSWPPDKTFEEIDFNYSPFWIQAHRLPPNKINAENARMIKNLVGKFMEVDLAQDGLGYPIFLQIRTEVPITAALLPGFQNKKQNGETQWVSLKYEKLPDLCYTGGR
ncbi:hypothetical protein GH714_002168 [Hevea brasiliensis]|uniref:Uncharacterized protein n=1 Tax=Hevea brasiliensis TaxID=3981 RepID=A0A6A6LCD3_HEVBR|nr:hypothetical protein GH714_002168 [Hevea brasiliensis]